MRPCVKSGVVLRLNESDMYDKLFEKLMNSDEQEFIESIKFGLIILDESGWMIHFCGYPDKPTNEDREQLRNELKADESFGLTERSDLWIRDASQEQVDFYRVRLRLGDFHYG